MPTPIDYDELSVRIHTGDITLLDAQGPGWFEREHLPGAHRLDWDDIAGSAAAAAPNPTSEIAVYCWSTTCTGSEVAADELERLGYTTVRRYVAGKQDWIERGGGVEAAST